MPRKFSDTSAMEQVIYEPNETVAEMYFILDGLTGIGFYKPKTTLDVTPYMMIRKQKGHFLIGDHYVFN